MLVGPGTQHNLLTTRYIFAYIHTKIEVLVNKLNEANTTTEEANTRADRLEKANQALHQQHQKDLEQAKAAMDSKVGLEGCRERGVRVCLGRHDAYKCTYTCIWRE